MFFEQLPQYIHIIISFLTFLPIILKPVLTLLAVALFGIHAYKKRDWESFAWFVIIIVWAI